MSLLNRLKNKLSYLYVSYAPLVNRLLYDLDFTLDGTFLIATKRGLYQIHKNQLFFVMKGNFYGITYVNDSVYVFQRIYPYGRIVTLTMNKEYRFTSKQIFMNSLSPGCHQIDVYNEKLFICDSNNNRIIKNDLKSDLIEYHYPLGKLKNGRRSENYGHINSIFILKDKITILCHNQTANTGKYSEIFNLNKQFHIKEKIETLSNSAHNILPLNGKILHCDSLNAAVKLDKQVVFKGTLFTRGLSVSDSHILVGGSEYRERDEREKADGCIYVLRKNDFNFLYDIKIPGMVQEIRRLDGIDYSMSQYADE